MDLARDSLGAHLLSPPVPLRFGTSGRRGEVVHLTQLEVYTNVLAELHYLQSKPPSEGGIRQGDKFYFAYDLRPSSSRFVPEQQGRGEIAQTVARAIEDSGMKPVNLGQIPTPALTYYALGRGKGSIMVTGSHIPFDRNGYKTNSAVGELRKEDEAPIGVEVEQTRACLLGKPFASSPFGEDGAFKTGPNPLPPEDEGARRAYLQRYLEFFGDQPFRGKGLLVYQHSAVGRDLLVEILERLGAEVIAIGRSETFVPIDTENMEDAQLRVIQTLAEAPRRAHGRLDGIVSTDGDSDRPLILGIEAEEEGGGRVRFFPGDLVGMVTAECLEPDAVVVPISCNDAVDRGSLKHLVQAKTRIGSPFVLAGMDKARGRRLRAVCGWEANGGFLLGSDFVRQDRVLSALPTRDAMLPILAVLLRTVEQECTLSELFDRLPRRFSKAGLLRNFPRAVGQAIVRALSPSDSRLQQVRFTAQGPTLLDQEGGNVCCGGEVKNVLEIRRRLETVFARLAAGGIVQLNFLDGLRIYFANGEIAHLRPSGNADEMRVYAVADDPSRAEAIVALGLAEPDGILRTLEQSLA